MEEIWKPVVGYEGLYEVSNLGNVKSLNYNHTKIEKVLRPGKKKLGYSQVILCKNGNTKLYTVHRLVGIHFIPNPFNLHLVCHKREDLDENGMLYNGEDNLFWGTAKDNIQDMINKGRQNFNGSNGNNGERKVSKKYSINQYSLEGEFIKTWESCRSAGLFLGFSKTGITSCCNKEIKKSNGYIWEYAN